MHKKVNPETLQNCLDLNYWGNGGSNWVALNMFPMFFVSTGFGPTELIILPMAMAFKNTFTLVAYKYVFCCFTSYH